MVKYYQKSDNSDLNGNKNQNSFELVVFNFPLLFLLLFLVKFKNK